MLSLYYKLDDTIQIDGKDYHADLAFDNVLKIIDMLNDQIPDIKKLNLGMMMLFGIDTDLVKLPIEDQQKLFTNVFYHYVNQQEKETPQVDLQGNPLPAYKKDKQNFYSLKHDAELIYASFMQAYGIDLIDQQGKLHWYKFQALLAGLPEETKFRQVVSIRMWEKPKKSDSEEKRMRELKKIYALPDGDKEVD